MSALVKRKCIFNLMKIFIRMIVCMLILSGFFTFCVIVYLGHVFYYRSNPLMKYFFHGKIYVIILTKNVLGYILGDFVKTPP
jgi:hypothetical protein